MHDRLKYLIMSKLFELISHAILAIAAVPADRATCELGIFGQVGWHWDKPTVLAVHFWFPKLGALDARFSGSIGRAFCALGGLVAREALLHELQCEGRLESAVRESLASVLVSLYLIEVLVVGH